MRHWLIRMAFIFPVAVPATKSISARCLRSCANLRRHSLRKCVLKMPFSKLDPVDSEFGLSLTRHTFLAL